MDIPKGSIVSGEEEGNMYECVKMVPCYWGWWGVGTIFSGWNEVLPGTESSLLRFYLHRDPFMLCFSNLAQVDN